MNTLPKRLRSRKPLSRRLSPRLSQVAPAIGYALTVFRSPRVSHFPLQIESILPGEGVSGLDLILARAFGPTVGFYGGVPYGTSGSPVYVHNHLIGAISTLFYPDAKLIGITPKTAMLSIAEEKTPAGFPVFPAAVAPTPARITTIGLTSGRALGEVNSRFGPPLLGNDPGFTQNEEVSPLQPGSPIGAALMIGDIKLGFIGTATIVEDNQVFAFGHPLLFSGPTNLPLTTARIADTARGDPPNKVGTIGQVIGTVLQDRAAGIYAKLGQRPELIEMKFTVRDEDRDHTEILRTQAAPLPSELAFLTFVAAVESMQRAMNRVGPGSAFWDWSIWEMGSDLPIQITGSAYDPYDIGSVVAAAVLPSLDQVLQSGVGIASIELTASVTINKLPEDNLE